ncbi:MAG: toll/interleukin-1 receptor domain-containing protein [Terriglobia bacterium]|jgi:uncharacterized protein YjbI with pentapeptide repeats
MANEEHVKILEQGVEAWNQWRRDNPEVRPDLSDADLHEAKLSEANLGGADLAAADLSGANLMGADFRLANLTGADLGRAFLSNTNLALSRLNGANLGWTDLIGANLTQAELDGADLSNAFVGATMFANSDLSSVKGLGSMRHFGPSTIGIDTIYKSKGNIPEVFLRGAGVPEDFIVYMKSLVGKPIEFYSCFISYSSKDDDFARRLHADLQQSNVRVWFAPEDLKIGDKFRPRIDESIRIYDKLMVVLSANSIQSPWVEEEVEAALEKERKEHKLVLFPIRLDDAVMDTQQAWAASLRRTRHIGDFRNWKDHDAYREAYDRLLRDLKAEKTVAGGSPQ